MTECAHKDARSTADLDTGVHAVVCTACFAITHVCLSPLPDDIEQDLEKVREWGVTHAKTAARSWENASKQQEMERILAGMRNAMFMAKISKNTTLEAVAKVLAGAGHTDAASLVRNLKLETNVCEAAS